MTSALQRSNLIQVKIKDQNNIVINVIPTSFTFLKKAMVKLATNKTSGLIHIEGTSKLDPKGQPYSDILRFFSKDTMDHLFTVNLFTTTCNVHINGEE